jgi:hypothetical protein
MLLACLSKTAPLLILRYVIYIGSPAVAEGTSSRLLSVIKPLWSGLKFSFLYLPNINSAYNLPNQLL